VASIHGQTRATEEGLERRLRYDRWARHAFRLLLFGSFKRYGDYEALRLEESATFAGGAYKVVSSSADMVVLACEATLSASLTAAPADGQLRAIKTLSFAKSAGGFELGCQVELLSNGPGSLKIAIGLEVVLNLLAADEPDRYFQVAGDRHPLAWGGDVPVAELRVVDEWQGVAVTLDAPGAERFWIAPIETVSESEKGFERVYQGSQILPIWPVEISSGAMWAGKVTLRVLPSR
jgi:alpha-amylase